MMSSTLYATYIKTLLNIKHLKRHFQLDDLEGLPAHYLVGHLPQ